MINNLYKLSANKWYWLGLLALSIAFEATALFYQYVLEYPPCVLCIHTRIWILGMILVSLLALQFYRSRAGLLIMQLLMLVLTAGLLERSYQLLGVERGFITGSCSMESGLPAWFALDQWLPVFFQVWEPCGYTPELFFGITMAELLIVIAFLLLLMSIVVFFTTLFVKTQK